MQRRKITVISVLVSIIIIAIVFFYNDKEDTKKNIAIPVAEATDLSGNIWDEYNYDNLIFHEFESPICKVNELYKLEIRYNRSFRDRTFVENFEIMDKVIDDFFMEEFDKSYINVKLQFSNEEEVSVNYNDVNTIYNNEKYNHPSSIRIFGNNTSNGGYMVQIAERLNNIWFSKNGFGTIHPSMCENPKVYPYISGKRQVADVDINLKDGSIKLSEMEERVLNYLKNDFPTEIREGIEYSISQARVIDLGEYQGICFRVRRKYKDVLFETGSNYGWGEYVDDYYADCGEISYVESTSPDTIMTFGAVNGPIIEQETITEMISLDEAINKLSESIGDNSIYDVYGVELVYREILSADESIPDIDARLAPKWKIITINQNDDKYTLFYVDVVTGEITQRFDFYFE